MLAALGAMPAVNGAANGHEAGAAMKPLNHCFSSLPTTVFEVMSKLANEHRSVNLGQGFPDQEGPESMKKVSAQLFLCAGSRRVHA